MLCVKASSLYARRCACIPAWEDVSPCKGKGVYQPTMLTPTAVSPDGCLWRWPLAPQFATRPHQWISCTSDMSTSRYWKGVQAGDRTLTEDEEQSRPQHCRLVLLECATVFLQHLAFGSKNYEKQRFNTFQTSRARKRKMLEHV